MKSKIITLPCINGSVSVKRLSRIKVYRMIGGSIKGYLLDFDGSYLTIMTAERKKAKISTMNLGGFAFYPEVNVLQDSCFDVKVERGAEQK